jgi:hypothetical protein
VRIERFGGFSDRVRGAGTVENGNGAVAVASRRTIELYTAYSTLRTPSLACEHRSSLFGLFSMQTSNYNYGRFAVVESNTGIQGAYRLEIDPDQPDSQATECQRPHDSSAATLTFSMAEDVYRAHDSIISSVHLL